jgi:hypothetical protein
METRALLVDTTFSPEMRPIKAIVLLHMQHFTTIDTPCPTCTCTNIAYHVCSVVAYKHVRRNYYYLIQKRIILDKFRNSFSISMQKVQRQLPFYGLIQFCVNRSLALRQSSLRQSLGVSCGPRKQLRASGTLVRHKCHSLF